MNGRWATLCSSTLLLLSMALTTVSVTPEDDVRCLRELKQSLGDPDGKLAWNFSNNTVGFVCNLVGVACWNPQENRILSLSLPSMSLTGSIPSALKFCSVVNALDLSGNSLTGPIPPDFCEWMPYVVNLDLSGNRLTGSIPPELSNCSFLNSLTLSSNSLSGTIPASLSRLAPPLNRLKHLDLSHNALSGEIPPSLASSFPSSSVFDSNDGLCGRPVSSHCGSRSHTSLIIIIAAGVFGALASVALAFFVWRCYFSSEQKKTGDVISGEEGRLWVTRLRTSHNRLLPVSLFQKPIVKVKLADLLSATGDFHQEYIIIAGSERVGTSFKAVLPDGSALAVKRLNGCSLGEKQFRAEMGRISQLRHPNLVPLLGFCVVEDERFLVYKYMPDGALSSLLRSSAGSLKWLARLRIGIGAAHGLAWLHHGFPTPFLHQAITSSAILLDEDWEARITDFGLPRLVSSSSADAGGARSAGASPFLNGDFGEFGYIPPEYASNPIATTKGDVYAFGVVLLELITGQKPTEVSSDFTGEVFKGNLVDWINQLAAAGHLSESFDWSLRGEQNDGAILQFLKIAMSCVAYRPKERPSMYRVYQSLKSIGDKYNSSEQFEEFPLVYGKEDSDSL
ncbi:LOW QUALITY PROTEIN: inactive LRR receptor-like serine/threonine-protein kinase BIR2 [Phalaenopsis equestris]|uniref:LOW QUALITY PROTEIN: inactive LRR receptor-like serine/threonine-protein kinase BIR2 n=1 Tax=Phalaenopsis equestris TaxID=78828 RepID=UPI0009E205B9|nr:LOW QUALITY PROTEIN: inactive LRR receptor-like serine/threonine-protein kinase BIR2 [Phalaenopsis equestris]